MAAAKIRPLDLPGKIEPLFTKAKSNLKGLKCNPNPTENIESLPPPIEQPARSGRNFAGLYSPPRDSLGVVD